MEEQKKPLVVALAKNCSTALGVIRALGSAGYQIDLVASVLKSGDADIAAASRFLRNCTEVVSRGVEEEEYNGLLLEELLKHANQDGPKPVLIPTDNWAVRTMLLNRSDLEPYFRMAYAAGSVEEGLELISDRALQREKAMEAGLLTRLGWEFPADEVPVLPDDMVFPCVCMRVEEDEDEELHKKKAAVCADEESFYNYFLKLRSKGAQGTVWAREYLDVDQSIEVSGVCLDQQVIMPAIVRKKHMAEHDEGETKIGVVEPIEAIGEIGGQIADMLRKLHYVGIFNVQLKLVEDRIYFSKVNFCTGRTGYAYFKSGINLHALFVDYLVCGEAVLDQEKIVYGKHFLQERGAWNDFIHGYITKQELDEAVKSVDFTLVCDEDDPNPGKLFMQNMQKAAVKGRFRMFKRQLKKKLKRLLFPPLRKLKYTLLNYPQMKKENQRDPNAEKPRVVVAGRNYCSNLCLARAFGTAGYEVEVLRIFQIKPRRMNLMKGLKPDAYSKYVKAYYVCVTRRKNSRIINKLMAIADPDHKMLLIPADDLVANVVDENLDQLREFYLIPNVDNKQGEINRLMSKEVQKELARAAGLPVINSCVIKTENGQFTIPESVSYPCFMKPNISKNGLKSRMRKCESEEELRGYLTEFSEKRDVEMLVEDFVDIGREYSILGVSTRDGAVGPGFFGAEEGGHDERRGVALTGEVVSPDKRQQLVDDILAFIGTLNFEGLFDVDLIETADGKMYFVELNLRFGGSGYAITASGVNLPGMFADYMIQNKPVDKNCRLEQPGKHFISEKIMIEEYMKGYLTASQARQHLKQADIHFIMDDVDKRPYRHYRRYYPIAAIMRILYRVKAARANK